jgi:hypothetical protein
MYFIRKVLIEDMKHRLFFAFYLSVILHTSLIVVFFTNRQLTHPMYCGIEENSEEIELFNLNLSIIADSEIDFNQSKSKENGKSSNNQSEEDNTNDKNNLSQGNGSSDNPLMNDPKWKELFEKLNSTKDLRKNFLESYDGIFQNSNVPMSYIKRYRHYEDMVVKEVFPSIHSIEKPFSEELNKAEENLIQHNQRNKIIEDFRNNNFESVTQVDIEDDIKMGNQKRKIPLVMNENERDEYLDSILLNSKESQLDDFLSKFSDYDPDKGDLPFVFRDLYYKNLQRLAYTFSSDPTYFSMDYFEENLNKEDYLRNAMDLASRLKDSKTSIEILFTILDIYEIQERAIYQYFQNISHLKSIPESQKNEIRIETLRQLIKKYNPIFQEKKIQSMDDVNKLYKVKKLQIMDYMKSSNPTEYRKNDISFEKGRILWEEGYRNNNEKELNSAVSEWKEINSKGDKNFLNREHFLKLQEIIGNKTISQLNQSDRLNITGILMNRNSNRLEEKRKREDKLLWKD